MRTLVQSHSLYSRAHPNLISLLLTEPLRADIFLDCLQFVHDISEVYIVKMLRFVLKPEVRIVFGSESFELTDGKKLSIREIKELILNLILRRPVNDNFLRFALTILEENEVIILLNKFKERFEGENCFNLGIVTLKSDATFKFPSFEHCLEWISALIDAHTNTLLFSGQCLSRILDLSLIVHKHIHISKELSPFAGHLWNLVHRRERQNQSQRDYSIDSFII